MISAFYDQDVSPAGQAFEQVIGRIQAAREGFGRARVLGIAGCKSGDGVTFVLEALARLLAQRSGRRVLQAECTDLLAASCLLPSQLLSQCWYTDQGGLWILSPPGREVASMSTANPAEDDLRAAMSVLRSRFDFVLLDCGAVTASGRLWQLASVLDDVLLVVAAGETKRAQVAYAQRIIEQSGAHLSGCILNKRSYPLPLRIHRLLQ